MSIDMSIDMCIDIRVWGIFLELRVVHGNTFEDGRRMLIDRICPYTCAVRRRKHSHLGSAANTANWDRQSTVCSIQPCLMRISVSRSSPGVVDFGHALGLLVHHADPLASHPRQKYHITKYDGSACEHACMHSCVRTDIRMRARTHGRTPTISQNCACTDGRTQGHARGRTNGCTAGRVHACNSVVVGRM